MRIIDCTGSYGSDIATLFFDDIEKTMEEILTVLSRESQCDPYIYDPNALIALLDAYKILVRLKDYTSQNYYVWDYIEWLKKKAGINNSEEQFAKEIKEHPEILTSPEEKI